MNKTGARAWLITGCDKGMGYAIAEAVLKNGDRVAATVLQPDGAQALVDLYGNSCRTYQLDVRDKSRSREVAALAEKDFGQIDVLVSNAGYGLVGAAEETDEDEYRPLFEVNFFGAVEVANAVIRGMRERRSGHIICITSLVGFVGLPGFAFYSASKFALEGYCEAIAAELRPFGVRVTAVEPGGFRTDFAGSSLAKTKRVIDDYAESSGQVRRYMQARNGTQPGNPVLLGVALCNLVNLPDPPLRISFGADALEKVKEKLNRTSQDCDKYEALTLSTSFN